MMHLLKKLCRFHRDQEGPTTVEYAVMISLIVAVCSGSVILLGDRLKDSFDDSSTAIDQAFHN